MEYTGMYNDDFVSINYLDIPPNSSTNSSYLSSTNNPHITTVTPLSSPPSSLLSPTIPIPSSTTSTTLFDKIKSFKTSYNNQRRNTLQFSICKKSGCNNRLIIDDSKTMGYCSMMCQLNDWSQPSTLTDSINDDCGLGEESQLNLGGNNELSGMNAGNRFSGINFTNFGATKRENDNGTNINNQQNYFALNNSGPDRTVQPQQPLSFDHTSEFIIMTTCSTCSLLNDSRSIMCIFCHNPLSTQELNIPYLNDDFNEPVHQPHSLPSQPQIQQQLQHQIQQQSQPPPQPKPQPPIQQQLPFPRLHSHPSQPLIQQHLEQLQILQLQIQRQLRPPNKQQFQRQLQPQFPFQPQTQEQLVQHLQMQQNVQLQMQQQQQIQSQVQQSQVQQPPLQPKRQLRPHALHALLRRNKLQNLQLQQKLLQQRSKQPKLKRLQSTSHLQAIPQSQPQPQLLSNFSIPTSIPSSPASDPTNKCVLSKTKLKVLFEGDAEYNQIRDYFYNGLPHANIHSIIQLQMPTKLINAHARYKHNLLLNNLSTTQDDSLDMFTNRMFHGTKISCNPKRLINGHNSYCMFNCGMCGILQNGNQRKYSRFNGRMWFANSSAISLGYCNLSTSRTIFNCTPFASKSSLLAMFVVDVVSYNSSDIIIVDKDEATLPRYLILFEIGC
ncbi:3516_t:CDS:2 [Funneliformis geosporum]|uniref:3516_t:CDS:1 n=1 Tax=Funneliformis geosporum TaxID=1117311 RepID=A0A9W4SED6_9GLOM|nr:3516_t:CDS:2 [Funneliformis geosporum]